MNDGYLKMLDNMNNRILNEKASALFHSPLTEEEALAFERIRKDTDFRSVMAQSKRIFEGPYFFGKSCAELMDDFWNEMGWKEVNYIQKGSLVLRGYPSNYHRKEVIVQHYVNRFLEFAKINNISIRRGNTLEEQFRELVIWQRQRKLI